jgi:hypothetical protein
LGAGKTTVDVGDPDAARGNQRGALPRVGGFRVVMSWPDSQFAPAPPPRGRGRIRLAGLTGVTLIVFGAAAIGVALLAQQHAPSPGAAAAGKVGPAVRKAPSLRRSPPVSMAIPAIGVQSSLLSLGLNANGTLQVPDLATSADQAAWYKYSVTPGQRGTSVIEGHVDSAVGPAVFYRLGALRPGNRIDVRLADGITAVFKVTGVREYAKTQFPTAMVYGPTSYASLRLVTCGGTFDFSTGHYLSSVVVFASLVSTGGSETG